MYSAVDGPLSDPVLINDTMFTFEDLNGDTEYVFSIAAATSAGLGPDVVTSNKTAGDGMHIWLYSNADILNGLFCVSGFNLSLIG